MFDDWQNEATLNTVMDKIGVTYEVLKYLGGGGMSKIYQVYNKGLNKIHILKIMDFTFLMNIFEKRGIKDINGEFNKIKDRFRTEAKIYWEFAIPNIVEIFDFGFAKSQTRDIDIPYLIMEYIEGKNLKDFMSEKGNLDLKTIFKISGEVLTTLDSIHQKGIIHRDIKPSNIMIRDKNQEVVILDFGIAKDTIANLAITDPHTAMGTLSYTSPEMLADSKTVTLQTDIYSFGIVLYEMITGELPFRGSAPEVLLGHLDPEVRFPKNPRITGGLNRILKKALAKVPTDRYENANEFLKALREIEKEIDEKPKKKYIYLSIALVISIAAFFVLKSTIPEWKYNRFISSARTYIEAKDWQKADEALKKAQEIKGMDTGEIVALSNEIVAKQIDTMKEDFDMLKKFLASPATEKEKTEKCREFLAKHQNISGYKDTQPMLDEANRFISNLNADFKAGEQYQKYIDTVSNLIKNGDYERAKGELDKARKIDDTDEVKRLSITITEGLETERKNGDKEYKAIKDKINLNQYKAFQGVYPNSIYLRDLKERLKAADKNLPLEKYWDKPISKNGKGYYELTFGIELNGHRMIYIPEKKIWIDKYEVSWAQFRRYLRDEKRSIPSTVSNEYINNGDGFPAVVTYEEAEKYCKKYGFQLPNKDEWECVAGKGSLTYPWGNESPDTPTSNSQWRANLDTLDGAKDKDGYKGTAPVKSFEPFSSPFGAVNMAGNVWEWIQGKALKGGGYLSLEDDLRIENVRQAEPLDKEGFRCMKAED
ncbi:MAG: protein kinase [Candidatus Aminicenantes bacterium]|nr:protein kinase [Candidatus Aminicenantes bacterium]